MSVPLNPPPPYCSERPFQSAGRLTWKRIGGALGSVGSIWPSTLQKAGLAGAIRPDGVAARSATDNDEAGCIWAESTCTASGAGPARPLQVAAGSPLKPAANAEEVAAKATSTTEIPVRPPAIVPPVFCWICSLGLHSNAAADVRQSGAPDGTAKFPVLNCLESEAGAAPAFGAKFQRAREREQQPRGARRIIRRAVAQRERHADIGLQVFVEEESDSTAG